MLRIVIGSRPTSSGPISIPTVIRLRWWSNSMEGQQERRNVGEIEPVGGQPSRNSGQTGLEPEEHRIDIVEISHRDWIESLRTAEESTQWRRIPKVPQMLRGTQDFKKFYEPRVISIGPYHHGKPHLHPGEMIKPLCAPNFLDDSKQDIEALYTKIESNMRQWKSAMIGVGQKSMMMRNSPGWCFWMGVLYYNSSAGKVWENFLEITK